MGNYRTWAQNADANPLSAQLAERDAEIAALKAQVETREADVRQLQKQLNEAGQIVRAGEAERKALAAQVAELQAWKDAVPVVEIVRYTFDQYDNTTISSSDDWHKIKDWMDVVSPE